MGEPIEIKEKDLIERPLGGVKLPGTKPSNILGEIKAGVKQAKEIIDMAKEMGLHLKLPGGLLTQGGEEPQADAPGVANPLGNAKIFLHLLIAKYGDITVNQLIEKLRAEIGDKKLSSITGGK